MKVQNTGDKEKITKTFSREENTVYIQKIRNRSGFGLLNGNLGSRKKMPLKFRAKLQPGILYSNCP